MNMEYDVNESVLKSFSGSTDIEMMDDGKNTKLVSKKVLRTPWPTKRYSWSSKEPPSTPEDGRVASHEQKMPSEPLVSMEKIFVDKSEFEEEIDHDRHLDSSYQMNNDDDIVEIAVSDTHSSVASTEEAPSLKRLGVKSSFKLTLSSFNTSFILPPTKTGPYKTESKLIHPQSSLADQVAAEIGALYYEATQCNSKEALEGLHNYSHLGYHIAEGFLMRIYALGQCGVEKDLHRAQTIALRLYPIFRDMAEANEGIISIYAHYHLGVCYSEGLAVNKDPTIAIAWYRESANRGYTGAQAYLGYCYYHGIGVQKNQPEAVKWYQLAADQGHSASQFNLAVCYEQEHGVSKNMEQAVRYYRMAADQGSAAAQYNLGRCYEKGEGIMQNYHKSFDWYNESAKQGYTMSEYALGCCYLSGFGTDKDLSKGIEYLIKACNKDYDLALVKLGLCYEEGNGVTKSLTTAIQYYYKASELGNSSALYRIGHFLFHGKGVEKDFNKAVIFFQLASQRHHRIAQIQLGICYQTGQGIKKDPSIAFKLFKTTASAGIAEGQYQLARCYEIGLGTNVDMKEAIKYYKIAERKGNAEAHQALERLRGSL